MARLSAIVILVACVLTASAAPRPDEAQEQKKLDALLAGTGSKCLAAKTAGELNPLWTELTRQSEKLNGYPSLQNRLTDLHGAIHFVTLWRDYLAAKADHDFGKARDILMRLLESRNWLALTPRSPVLAKLEEKEGYIWRSYPTDTPDDIPKVIAALEDIQRLTKNPSAYQQTIRTLYALQEIWKNRDKGNWNLMVERCRVSDYEDNVDVRQFKLQILAYALPGYLNLDTKKIPKWKDGESALPYLDRIAEHAAKSGDMVTLWRVSTYRNHLSPSRVPWVVDEIAARELCVAGQKKETDGQSAEAIASYLQVSKYRPSDDALNFACGRLAHFRKNASEVYAEGLIAYGNMMRQQAEESRNRQRDRFRNGMAAMENQHPNPDEKLWEKY